LDVKFIPGVEITHADPRLIPGLARLARDLGAKIVVCHGETEAEPVIKGTNHVAVKEKGLIDILAHPGNISEEDAALAAKNGVYLELTSKAAHGETNRHVAEMSKRTLAKLLVNTDAHRPEDYLTQESVYKLARRCGLSEKEAITVIRINPRELLDSIK
jgi:histidinol phosphatase-like PHP family hydrolase